MEADDDFETTAEMIFGLVREVAQRKPGEPRHLILSVEGHRNDEGGFDLDAWELMSNFIPDMLAQYLCRYTIPFGTVTMNAPQRDDVPHRVLIASGEGAEREAKMRSMLGAEHVRLRRRHTILCFVNRR